MKDTLISYHYYQKISVYSAELYDELWIGRLSALTRNDSVSFSLFNDISIFVFFLMLNFFL